MKTPSENDFELRKFKMTKRGGLHCEWEQVEAGEGKYDVQAHTRTSNNFPHFDLTVHFERPRAHLKEVCKLLPEADLTLTGMAFKGTDNTESVMITGAVITDADIPVGVSTHLIKFADGVYGFEDELRKACKAIKREVYRYLFEEKRSELEVEFTAEDEGGEN